MNPATGMRVCIDGTPLLVRSAGVKTYLYHWLRSLQSSSTPHKLTIFPTIERLPQLDHRHSVKPLLPTAFHLAKLAIFNRSWLSGGPSCDVFHASNLVRSLPSNAVAITATLHDLTTWTMPEMHTPGNIAADQAFAQTVLSKASRLIAVSEHTRQDAIKVLRFPSDRIDVIHHGVPDAYFRATPQGAEIVAEKYRLERPYILFCATIEPRKNLDLLLDAYALLAPSLKDTFDLVVAGMPGWGSQATLERLKHSNSGVRYVGYVAESEMPGLTRGATVFVYPSLYEGFGLPLAQAMAAGVAAITSGVSSMPEIAGDGALLVDPKSTGELRAAMARLLLSPSERESLAVKARRQAERYRWEVCAAKSWAFFEKAIACIPRGSKG
ncbi:MAG: glycosyltransferase family 4 protein [Acidobacteriota bacterium]|nr:glycosyltransferase family 4 protein [Acidobacteriota bacterium]